MRKLTWLVLALSLLSFAEPVFAQQGISAVTVTTNQDGTQDYSMTLQALFIMTALSLIPAFIMMMTSFTRIIVVLSILRQAIGLQQSPSNQILIGVLNPYENKNKLESLAKKKVNLFSLELLPRITRAQSMDILLPFQSLIF